MKSHWLYESSMQMAELQRLHLPQACTIAGRDVSLDSRALSPCHRPHVLQYRSLFHGNMTTIPLATQGKPGKSECLANVWTKTIMTTRTVT